MPDVISLGVGEPDFNTPPQVVEEGVRSLRTGRTHYTSNYGTHRAAPRAVIHLRAAVRLSYDPEKEICSRSAPRRPSRRRWRRSSTRATRSSFTSPRTWRTCRRSCSTAACRCSCRPRAATRSQLEPGRARGGHHAAHQGAVPGLPVQPDRRRARSRRRCAPSRTSRNRHDLIVVSDEIYDRLVYGGHRHVPISSLPGMRDRTITHRRLLEGVRDDRLARRLCLRAARPARGHRQGPPVPDHVRADDRAGRGAWSRSPRPSRTSQRMVHEYDRRRQMFVAGLNDIGLPTAEPKGAFYAFPSIRSTRPDQRRVQRAAALRASRRGRARVRRSGRRGRATCGPRWLPRTRISRRL